MPLNVTYHLRCFQLYLQLRLTLLNQSGYYCFITDKRRKANVPALLAIERLGGGRGGNERR